MKNDTTQKKSQRLVSLDWMRGFVMILMVIDHASLAFNGDRLAMDSASTYVTGKIYSIADFMTRWSTHLCAPTFVFLAGTALALSTERRVAKGLNAREIDRSLIQRGFIIAMLDPTLISLLKGELTFQVLFAIGMGMILMAFIRKLPSMTIFILAIVWLVAGEWITGLAWDPKQGTDVLPALLVAIYHGDDIRVIYPVIPWLSMMMLGWVFGQYLSRYLAGDNTLWSPIKFLVIASIGCLAVYILVRGMNEYGNMFLLRESDTWIHWLFVSKYPPSLTFITLELGIMGLFLAGFMWLEKQVPIRPNGVLLVFGQTALFFYVLHRIILDGSSRLLGLEDAFGLADSYIISVVLLVFLYPTCLWYRSYKQSHPESWVRYI